MKVGGTGTYDDFHCDGDGAVEGWGPLVLGHHRQVNHPVGNLLVVERLGDADHLDGEGNRFTSQKISLLFYIPKFGCPKGERTCVALHHHDAEELPKGGGGGDGVLQDVVGGRVLIGGL